MPPVTRPADNPDEIPDSELSLPYFPSELPTDWQVLAEYASDQPSASAEPVEQPIPQIMTETTLDTWQNRAPHHCPESTP